MLNDAFFCEQRKQVELYANWAGTMHVFVTPLTASTAWYKSSAKGFCLGEPTGVKYLQIFCYIQVSTTLS